MKFQNLSEQDISLLKSQDITTEEIASRLNIGHVTVSRWRKKLNIKIKKGVKTGTIKSERILWKCLKCDKQEYRIPSGCKTLYCRPCLYTSDSWKEKLKSIDRSYMQTNEYKQTLIKRDTPEYTRYKNAVHRLTQKIYADNIDIINPHRYNRTLAGVDGGWQLDHIISVRFGFDNNLPIELICEVENLRMIPWRENLARNKKN